MNHLSELRFVLSLKAAQCYRRYQCCFNFQGQQLEHDLGLLSYQSVCSFSTHVHLVSLGVLEFLSTSQKQPVGGLSMLNCPRCAQECG